MNGNEPECVVVGCGNKNALVVLQSAHGDNHLLDMGIPVHHEMESILVNIVHCAVNHLLDHHSC